MLHAEMRNAEALPARIVRRICGLARGDGMERPIDTHLRRGGIARNVRVRPEQLERQLGSGVSACVYVVHGDEPCNARNP